MGELPGFWEQLFCLVIIAVSMVFGGHLYRKRHDAPSVEKAARATKKKRPNKKRPNKKR